MISRRYGVRAVRHARLRLRRAARAVDTYLPIPIPLASIQAGVPGGMLFRTPRAARIRASNPFSNTFFFFFFFFLGSVLLLAQLRIAPGRLQLRQAQRHNQTRLDRRRIADKLNSGGTARSLREVQ